LAGVPLEGHLLVGGAEEFFQLAELAVGQGVHRVHDDRLDPRLVEALGLGLEDPIDDRDDICQALSGTGAGRQDVALAGTRGLDRFLLVAVEAKLLAVRKPEDVPVTRLQQALADKLADRPAGREARIERQPRLRPLVAVGHPVIDVLLDRLVVDVDETAGELPVVLDQPVTDLKDIHACPHTACACDSVAHPMPALSPASAASEQFRLVCLNCPHSRDGDDIEIPQGEGV
jgi:hypothetical protein